MLGIDLATDSDAADVAILGVAEECLVSERIVDVEAIDGVSVALECALVGRARLAAADGSPVVAAEVDVAHELGRDLIVTGIDLGGKPCQLGTVADVVYAVLVAGLGECSAVPCAIACLDHLYDTGLIALGIVGNGQRGAVATVAWLECLDEIGAVGGGIYAIGIGAQGVALMGDGILYAVYIGLQVDDEVLGLSDGDAHLGQLAEIGLVGNGGEVGRTTQILVDVAMGPDGVAEAVDLYHALVHDELFAGVVGGDVNSYRLCRGYRTEGVLTGTEDER